MNNPFFNINLDRFASSAKQISELSASIEATQAVVAKSNTIKLKGAEAQIESSNILADQREELEVMRATINALLKHNLEQVEQQAIASQERDKLEAERYCENLRFTKIAARTGVVGIILSIVAIALQLRS
jgi:hypothetical protein